MEDKIKNIINRISPPTTTYGFKVNEIRRGELDKIAHEIVKLFVIPDVVGRSEQLVCSHPNNKTYLEDGYFHCKACNGKWKAN
jgi:hypothetical protein